MPDPIHIAAIAAILMLAMFVRSAFGFGHGALAMPLLLMVVDLRVATPLLAAISFIVGLWILAGEWRTIRFRTTSTLTFGALVGSPLGVLALVYFNQSMTLLVLSIFLVIVSIRALAGLPVPHLATDRFALPAGFVAGVLGGAVNISGVPVAIYGSMRRWSPGEFRSSLTGFFFITGIASLIGYAIADLFTGPFWPLFGWCVVPAFFGNWLGKHVHVRMSRRVFERAVWGIILATALLLLGKELFG